jgi:hypothetical protein
VSGARDQDVVLIPDPWFLTPGEGAVAQLGERLLCKQEVDGSIPFSSTSRGLRPRGIRAQVSGWRRPDSWFLTPGTFQMFVIVERE